MAEVTVWTIHHMTNGGTAYKPDIRDWPTVQMQVDGDIVFHWYPFSRSYQVVVYGTDGPWEKSSAVNG